MSTESLLIDQLDENLLRILNKPIDTLEPRSHKLAKQLYKNCMDLGKVLTVHWGFDQLEL